ncbi:hypothetical protein [Streptomyces buecherae]|uniref:hypothetical protein n=1 Tax=Streptomyces buecherae TaxID=2763006 RepID=UPI001C26662D|nr:hypothetical protein [Streptomyces buecherae]
MTHSMGADPRCGACQAPVVTGPEGGYVCGQCWHLEEPPGYEEQRAAGLARARARREARTAARRAQQQHS